MPYGDGVVVQQAPARTGGYGSGRMVSGATDVQGSTDYSQFGRSWGERPLDLDSRKAFYDNLPESVLTALEGKAVTDSDLSRKDMESMFKDQGTTYSQAMMGLLKDQDAPLSEAEIKSALQESLVETNPALAAAQDMARYKAMTDYAMRHSLSMSGTSGDWRVYYNAPLESWAARVDIAMADTEHEKKLAIAKHTDTPYEEIQKDLGGRLLYWNKDLRGGQGAYASVDSLEVESLDFTADTAGEAPGVIGGVLTAFLPNPFTAMGAVGNTGRFLQNAAKVGFLDAMGYAGGEGVGEAIEHFRGMNHEEQGEIYSRMLDNFILNATVGTTFAYGTQGLMGLANNPASGHVTPEVRQVRRFVEAIETSRKSRDPQEFQQVIMGLDKFNRLTPDEQRHLLENPKELFAETRLRPSQINAAPFIARIEGIISKFPGSAGVLSKYKDRMNEVLTQEVAWMLRDVPNSYEIAPMVQARLRSAVEGQIEARQSYMGLLHRGYDEEGTGKMLYDVLDRGFNDFAIEAKSRARALDGLLDRSLGEGTGKQVIPTGPLKAAFGRMKNSREIRPAQGSPLSADSRTAAEFNSYISGLDSHITMSEYRAVQKRMTNYISRGRSGSNRDPGLETAAAQVGKVLRETVEGEGGKKAMRNRMRALGYRDDVIEKYMKDFKTDNAWYADQKMIWDSKSDPNATYALIREKYTKDGAGMEQIVHMLIPFGGDSAKGGAANLKFARQLMQDMTPEETTMLQDTVTSILLGTGNNRTPAQIRKLMTASDNNRAIMNTILGEGKYAALLQFAEYADNIFRSPAFKLSASYQNARKAVTGLAKPGGGVGNISDITAYQNVVDNMRAAGNHADADAVRAIFLEDMLNSSTYYPDGSSFPVLNGDSLLKNMNSFESRELKEILGDETVDQLTSLAQISRANKSGDTAGGLASGLFVLNMFRTGDLVQGALTGVKMNIVARIMTSPAMNWFGRDALAETTEEAIRQWSVAAAYVTIAAGKEDSMSGDPAVERHKWLLQAQQEVDRGAKRIISQSRRVMPDSPRDVGKTGWSPQTQRFLDTISK